MALSEAEPCLDEGRSNLHVSEDAHSAHLLRSIVDTEGIDDELAIG